MKYASAILFLILPFSLLAKAEVLDESESSKAAVSYLKMLTDGKYNLLENTALSNHCELSRRKEIITQLEFYRKTSLDQGDTYTLEATQTKGSLSALLLRAKNPASPLSTSIHAIAMVSRDGKWLPAPLPGSFSNTGYGYDLKLEKTAQTLERWMAREKITREVKARKKASSKIFEEIANRQKTINLKNITPEKSTLHLIEALRSKDIIQILAMMGAASGSLDEPLETSVDNVSRGISLMDTVGDWGLVTRPSTIVQIMDVNNTRKEVAVGFWDPLVNTFEKIIYFPFYKSENKTFTKLPPLLEAALLSKNNRWDERRRHRRSDQTTLAQKLPSEIFKHLQAVSHQDRQSLIDDILKFRKQENFHQLVSLLPRKGDFFAQDSNQKKSLQELSLVWSDLDSVKGHSMQVLDIYEDDHIALAPLQFAKPNRTGEFTVLQIWMAQLNGTWHLVPQNILTESGGPDTKNTMQELVKRMESAQKDHQEEHSRKLMEMVIVIEPPLKLDAPSKEDAQKTITNFLTLLHAKDTTSALEKCAILKGTSNQQTLRIFNYALRGAADQSRPHGETLGFSQFGKWTGVSLRTYSNSSKTMDYPLYLIANTPEGSKVLLDVDLRHPTNRGRELLNTKTWKKIERNLPEDSLTNIKAIYKEHEKLSSADIAKNNPIEEE